METAEKVWWLDEYRDLYRQSPLHPARLQEMREEQLPLANKLLAEQMKDFEFRFEAANAAETPATLIAYEVFSGPKDSAQQAVEQLRAGLEPFITSKNGPLRWRVPPEIDARIDYPSCKLIWVAYARIWQ